MVRGEGRAIQVARAFFHAATKLSDDTEDILPQVKKTRNEKSPAIIDFFPEGTKDSRWGTA